MDRRALKVYSRRNTATRESENTTTGNPTYLSTQPLKDNSNIRIIKFNAEQANVRERKQQHQLVTQTTLLLKGNNNNKNIVRNNSFNTFLTNSKISSNNSIPTSNETNSTKVTCINGDGNERPLKCLETLAQKAGITFDEKYDFNPWTSVANTTTTVSTSPLYSQSQLQTNKPSAAVTLNSCCNKSLTLEKSQSPAQQAAPGTVPLQILPEQLQQLQQYHQLQHASPFAAIQVKQEFPTQQHTLTGSGGTGTEIKHPSLLDAATQGQLQQMQMQLAQTASDGTGGGGPNSPVTQHTPTSAGAVAAMQQQHSATINTMSPMQLATATGQVTATGDWTQGRTVQLMQPSTGFIYPHMLVPGNLIQSSLGQPPIQVITAGKAFQGAAPQMIATTQNTKQMSISGNTGFSSGATYAIPSSQSPQTLLFSPVNVISQSPQQQNILQAMTAAANAQQQQQQQHQKGAVDAQKNLQHKVVQKVTTTTNNVQSAAGPVSASQQQQQQSTQQCVQVNAQSPNMPGSTTQIISPLQQTAGQPQPLQINATPWVQSVPFWSNGLQQLSQNPIIIRGTQADGTPGVFIQQPSSQTLQTQQQNQITLQCNVTPTPSKQRTQMEQLAAAKQQQTGQSHAQQIVQQHGTQLQVQQQPQQHISNVQQQQAVVQAHLQHQAAATVSAVNQQRNQTQILPQPGGTQIRPASSVSTQTAQNQSLLKQKMRTKQQPVRPALASMKTEPQNMQQVHQQQQQQLTKTNTVAGLQQQITAAVAAQQQQQPQPTMHQVVTSAGNKMVVMSAGTPITIQNGQTLQQAVDKQQQQQQLQLQQIQKQQQQYLQQQLIQQQFAQIQLQHQQQQQAAVHQQQQQQLQQVVAAQQQVGQQQQQQAQIQLQVGPQGFITAQQQHQLQNQLLQQQQQLQQQQLQQQQQQQQQRDQQQSQSIIHQIVVQQSPQPNQQQHQPQQTQQQITAVPFSVSSSTPASIATSQSLHQHVAYQTKTSNSLPTTSVVTISNQAGPLVTSTVGISQSPSQLQHQQLIAATIAATQQQQQHFQQQQSQHLVPVGHQQPPQSQQQQTVMPPPSSPSQNPILAMASMMNAATGGNLSSNNSLTTAVAMTSPIGNTTTTNMCSLPATPTKSTIEHMKTSSSAPTTPSIVNVNTNTALSAPSNPIQVTNAEHQSKGTPIKSIENKSVESVANIMATISTLSPSTTNNCASQQEQQQLSPAVFVGMNENSALTETPQMTVQPLETINEPPNESSAQSTATKQSNPNSILLATQTTESEGLKTPPSATNEKEKSLTAVVSSSPQEFSATVVTTSITCTPSISTTSITNTSGNFSTPTTTSTTCTTSISVSAKTTGPPPKSTPGATIVKIEKDLPKAMIKPNVLTHVIDGFIIQEANEPFPVTRKRYSDKDDSDELPQKKQALDDAVNNANNNINLCSSPIPVDMVACEQCGKPEHKTKLKKKRFCSQVCARQAKASISEQGVQPQQQQSPQQQIENMNIAKVNNTNDSNSVSHMDISNSTTSKGAGGIVDRIQTDCTIIQNLPKATQMPQPAVPASVSSQTAVNEAGNWSAVAATTIPPFVEQQPQMANWTVSDVCDFIKNLPGCSDYVDDFEQQEIDGQALLLLKENHLVNAMGMKLGPALKIVAKVESMKEVSYAVLNAANNTMEGNNPNIQ